MDCDEAVELLKSNFGLSREDLFIDKGIVYYKIMFILKGHLCSMLRPHDDVGPIYSINCHHYGCSMEWFIQSCLNLEVPE